jgi:hypothetical protein
MLADLINVKCNVGQEVHKPVGVRTQLFDIFQYVVTAQFVQKFV